MCRNSQAKAYSLIKEWSLEDHQYLRDRVPESGLKTPFKGGILQDIAKQVGSAKHS